ncbi:MAG: hypothetical protein FJX72_21725, partial [Armatimonadetes bacterium]|nr:hypothetical protein [Armatimonadota bacterium]
HVDSTVDVNGRIYVADTENNRIVRMDDMSGSGWTELGELNGPFGVCSDAQGRIYIAEYVGNRVTRVDNMAGDNPVHLSPVWGAMGVRVGPSGRIYVAATGGLSRFDDMQGNGLVERTGFYPRRIAIDSQERVLFTDQTGYVVRIDSMDDWSPEQRMYGGLGLDVLGIAVYEPVDPA